MYKVETAHQLDLAFAVQAGSSEFIIDAGG